MSAVIDCSVTVPPFDQVRAAGYVGVIRYLSVVGNPKNWTPGQLAAAAAAGLSVGAVFESTAGRALAGTAAGATDAQAAVEQLLADGVDAHVAGCIYFAVDTGALGSQVLPYFRGVCSVLPAAHVGVYGDGSVIQACHDSGLATYYWQSAASSWPGSGVVSPLACLLQRVRPTLGPIPGTDENAVLRPDWGQLGHPDSPLPVPTPRPSPAPDPIRTDMLPTLSQGATGQPVRNLQALLVAHGHPAPGPNAGIDGIFGAGTENALIAFQRSAGISADGVCGTRQSWPALLGL